MNLNKAVEDFLNSQLGVISVNTHSFYKNGLHHLTNYFHDADIEDIDRRQLRAWRAHLNESCATASANAYLRTTSRFLNWCIEEGELETSPMVGIKQLRPDDDEPKAILPDDVLRMIRRSQEERNLRNVAIILFLYSTGGRVGGLIELKTRDLSLDKGQARVHEKGGKWRTVFLEETAVSALRDYIQWQRPQCSSDHIFLSNRKKKLTRQGLWFTMKNLAKRAGVDGVCNPHSFRHAFAIGYLEGGGDLSSLSNLLGHSNIKTTHDYYAKWSVGQLKEAHRRHNPLNQLRPPVPITLHDER